MQWSVQVVYGLLHGLYNYCNNCVYRKKNWYASVFFIFLKGHAEVLCKLLQLLDSSQNLKHGLARAKRVKLVKSEIGKLKRKMSNNMTMPQRHTPGLYC